MYGLLLLLFSDVLYLYSSMPCVYNMDKEQIIGFLKQEGKNIGKLALENDETCNKIITYYRMLCRCWDGMTQVLLEEEIKAYMGRKGDLEWKK